MKKIFLAAAVMMMCHAGACSAEVTDSYKGIAVVSGHGDVLPEGVRVRLLKLEDGHYDFVATDTIANGQFKLDLPVEEGLTIAVIMFDYYAFPSMAHWLYLTPGATVEIDAIDSYMYTWPIKSSVPEQAEYDLYIDNSKDLWTEIQKAKMEYEKSGNYDAYAQKNDSIKSLIYLRDLELLKTRPVGTVWMDKAIEFAQFSKITSEDMNALYANLNDSIKKSPKGRALYGYLYPGSHLGIGDRIPNTEFHDLEGNAHGFSEFQGKWCLVDFWNSGCSACIRAIPELRELKKKYPETLELVSLSIDTENMWRKASEMFHLTGNNWNEGKDDYGIYRRLETRVLPTFVLLSPNGTIKDIWVGYGPGDLKHKISYNLRPKGNTEYAESSGLKSVLFPKYELNKTGRVLDIDRIEMDDEGTKVFFSFIFYPNKWISISPESYLTDSTGAKYSIIGSEGIVPGEHLYADNEGKGSFSITFKSIPEDITTIDFHEPEEDWSIVGIVLNI